MRLLKCFLGLLTFGDVVQNGQKGAAGFPGNRRSSQIHWAYGAVSSAKFLGVKNWGFVPISDAEAQHLASELKLAVLPQLTMLAEINGEPVGCFVAIPDLNPILRRLNGRLTPWGLVYFLYQRRRTSTVRVAMMGVKKRYRRLGIDLLMLAEAWKQGLQLGIGHGELAWILEDNPLISAELRPELCRYPPHLWSSGIQCGGAFCPEYAARTAAGGGAFCHPAF